MCNKDEKYITGILFSKLIIALVLGSSLVFTTSCWKLAGNYGINNSSSNLEADGASVRTLEYYSFLKFMCINGSKNASIVHEFFKNIKSYEERLIKLYDVNDPDKYIIYLDSFINNYKEFLDKLDGKGCTPLHWAVQNLNIQKAYARNLFESLLNKSDVNRKTKYNDTALHLASRLGLLNTVKELLKCGNILVNEKNDHEQTALSIAYDKIYEEIIDLLLKDPRTEYEGCCTICRVDICRDKNVLYITRCGHSFHKECITRWYSTNSSCPMCRQAISPVMKKCS